MKFHLDAKTQWPGLDIMLPNCKVCAKLFVFSFVSFVVFVVVSICFGWLFHGEVKSTFPDTKMVWCLGTTDQTPALFHFFFLPCLSHYSLQASVTLVTGNYNEVLKQSLKSEFLVPIVGMMVVQAPWSCWTLKANWPREGKEQKKTIRGREELARC